MICAAWRKKIRKYTGVTASAALTACVLFGCTRADVGTSSQSASNAAGNVGQSTVSGSALAGAGSGQTQGSTASSEQTASAAEGTTAGTPQAQPGFGQGSQSQASSSGAAQNVSGTTTPTASAQARSARPASGQQATAQQASTQGASTQQAGAQAADLPGGTAATASQPQAGGQAPVQDAADLDPGAGDAAESFTGEFEKSDGTESVVIALINDNLISFQFANSRIGSTAPASGNSAIYYGDDGYSISFDVAGDTLGVIIGGEGGEDSGMNGIYYRVVGGDDTIEEEETDDQEEAWDGDAVDGDPADSPDADESYVDGSDVDESETDEEEEESAYSDVQ